MSDERTRRWEEGIPHDPRSIEIMDFLMKEDTEGYFDWKVGGDGDNGEELMYCLDVYFAQKNGGK